MFLAYHFSKVSAASGVSVPKNLPEHDLKQYTKLLNNIVRLAPAADKKHNPLEKLLHCKYVS